MATRNTGEAATSPGDVANVFAPGIPDDDDDDDELAKLHAHDDDDDEVKDYIAVFPQGVKREIHRSLPTLQTHFLPLQSAFMWRHLAHFWRSHETPHRPKILVFRV